MSSVPTRALLTFTPDPEPVLRAAAAGVANVVGLTSPKGILDTSEEDWNRVMSVNVTGMFLVTKHTLPHLLARQRADAGGAAIVNISSVSGVRYIRPEVAYTVSKGAVNSLTLSTAMEFADRGALTGRLTTLLAVHTLAALPVGFPPPCSVQARPFVV